MPDNIDNKKDDMLPPRPGEKQVKKEIKGTPFAFYINGELIQTSKQEALSVMAQIVSILCYMNEQENME